MFFEENKMKRSVKRFTVACFGTSARALLAYALLLVGCASPAMAQGVRYNDVARTKDNRPLSDGAVAVCVANPTDPGNVGEPCQPLATIYTDATLLTTAANPIAADINGNFAFWA